MPVPAQDVLFPYTGDAAISILAELHLNHVGQACAKAVNVIARMLENASKPRDAQR